MERLPFRRVLAIALLAGVLAGLCAALFHYILTEPVIEQAILLEEQAHHTEAHEAPIVSRAVQKNVGLPIGFVVIGLSWGLLFAIAYHLLQHRLSALGKRRGALLLAFLAFWSLVLMPSLKYPANPPGVGAPETIEYRVGLYIGFLVMSVALTALAMQGGAWIAQRFAVPNQLLLSLVCLVLFSGIAFVLMPSNPDPVQLPADLVQSFRLLSLSGLALFWGVFGLCFAGLVQRLTRSGSYGFATPRQAPADRAR